MSDIHKSIQERQSEIKMQILKGFSEVQDVLEKAVYKDNAKNQKLQRVGKTYGGSGDEDKKSDKNPKKEDGKKSDKKSTDEEGGDSKDITQKHLDSTSSEDLQKFISNENSEPSLVNQAKKELNSRGEGNKSNSEEKPKDDFSPDDFYEKFQSVIKSAEDNQTFIMETDKELERIGGDTFTSSDLKRAQMHVLDMMSRDSSSKDSKSDKKENTGANKKENTGANQKDNSDIDQDGTLEILGEAIFNHQSKPDKKKIAGLYNDLVGSGLSDEEIEDKIGDMSWNHPDTPDGGMKDEWDSIIDSIRSENKTNDINDRLKSVDKSVNDLKKKLEPEITYNGEDIGDVGEQVLHIAVELFGKSIAESRTLHIDDLDEVLSEYDVVVGKTTLKNDSKSKAILAEILEEDGWEFER